MFTSLYRYAISVGFLILLLGQTQGGGREPKTAPEFYQRMKYELELGKFNNAAKMFDKYVELVSDDELYKLYREAGMSEFLNLRNIPEILENPRAKEAMKDKIEKLISRVNYILAYRTNNVEL